MNTFATGAQNSHVHCLHIVKIYEGMYLHAVTLWHGADEQARESWPWLQATLPRY